MAFNKLFVMLPVMLLARKIDGEDPNVVYWLRIAYGVIQTVCVLIVAYTYIQASGSITKNEMVIYVPPPPVPFADPNAKKKYQEVKFGAHVLSTSRSLLGSTLFGIALTIGLHLYKGMIVGLAIQTVMAPLNLIENAIVKALLLGNGLRIENRIFDEKLANELTEDDEIVDESGNPILRQVVAGDSANSFEEQLLDTWDAGNKADLGTLMSSISKDNCNYKTKENGWTPLMILSGLNAKGVASAIRQVKELGGDPSMTDEEGWTSLHWAAFHGSIEAAKVLSKEASELLSVKDKEGKIPLDMAKSEGNDEVAKVLQEAMSSSPSTAGAEDASSTKNDTGLRKRK